MDTVLVVEDSRAMQRTLQRLFESDSMQVQIAGDGLTGLELFRKQTPSAVILDLKLPGKSGKELCREFKSLAASVPIVVLSANSEVEDKVLLLELGADDYVTKPFSPRELLARVRRAMRRTGANPPVVSHVAAKPVNHEVLIFGEARIDFTSMEATHAGRLVTLTTQEFKLLNILLLPLVESFRAKSFSMRFGVIKTILPLAPSITTSCDFARNSNPIPQPHAS
jgi:Response regulators consisting of a CheY-like receiver domain and a winged-helix DNA-binding domain